MTLNLAVISFTLITYLTLTCVTCSSNITAYEFQNDEFVYANSILEDIMDTLNIIDSLKTNLKEATTSTMSQNMTNNFVQKYASKFIANLKKAIESVTEESTNSDVQELFDRLKIILKNALKRIKTTNKNSFMDNVKYLSNVTKTISKDLIGLLSSTVTAIETDVPNYKLQTAATGIMNWILNFDDNNSNAVQKILKKLLGVILVSNNGIILNNNNSSSKEIDHNNPGSEILPNSEANFNAVLPVYLLNNVTGKLIPTLENVPVIIPPFMLGMKDRFLLIKIENRLLIGLKVSPENELEAYQNHKRSKPFFPDSDDSDSVTVVIIGTCRSVTIIIIIEAEC